MNAALFGLILSICAFAANAESREEVRLYGASGDGKAIEYAITTSRAEQTPRWGSAKQGLPLSVSEAVAKADTWMRQQNPTIQSFSPNRIELKHVSATNIVGLWYYSIGFDAEMNGNTVYSWSLEAVVLMDGSIVAPRPVKR